MQMAGMKEGEAIESGMLTRQIEKAQRKVEAHNFDIRKNLLEFDDVANDQRKVVYQQRTEIMGARGRLPTRSRGIREDVGRRRWCDRYMPQDSRSTSSGTSRAWTEALAAEFGFSST